MGKISEYNILKDLLDEEINLPNVPIKTKGGETFWETLEERGGYRLQQNHIFKNARILDSADYRIAWGTVNGMYKVLRRLTGDFER